MNILLALVLSVGILFLGVRVYGRLVAKWLGEDPAKPTPAVEIDDGKDYVPTNPNILFGHHFSSIAGAGPIIGPVVGVLFGFIPVWLWILLGSIFIGAVHDFAALFVSLREKGRSIAEVVRNTLGKTGFFFFVCFAIMVVTLISASFITTTVASLISMVPVDQLGLGPDQTILRTVVKDGVSYGVIGGIASTSVIMITFFAPILGILIYKRRIHIGLGYLFAAIIALGSIKIGMDYPLVLDSTTWMIVLSIYVTIAAAIPVWLLLQPRDFTNVQILYVGIIIILITVVIGGFQGMNVQAPMVDLGTGAERLGFVWPFLFITVACGAVSGFHSIFATGMTSKQLAKEGQARKIGYNAMILEGLLATGTVLIICAALPHKEYMNFVWPTVEGVKSNPILAFSMSMGIMMHQTIGIPTYYGSIFGILLIEGFVLTTLDATVRLNRYMLEEVWNVVFKGNVPWVMKKSWFNAGLAVLLMLWLAWNNAFAALWPLFATTNQLLAALTLLTVSSWLFKRQRKAWFTILPAIFMVCTAVAALLFMLGTFLNDIQAGVNLSGSITLLIMDILCLGLAVGVVALAIGEN
ncbi:hypothetical protein LJC24_02450 [Desulfococcaceae bacterium OttesenSCG-928-F15]|nr:hypothetical protein [Desulfococcaceae bacterium OttesenSCG-928-F15]